MKTTASLPDLTTTAREFPPIADAIPQELRARRQWVNWRFDIRDNRPTKIPVNPVTRANASTTDENTWGTFEQALKSFHEYPHLSGIGFVFSRNDPYMGVDIDHCVDPSLSKIAPDADNLLHTLNTYAEFSQSGTGIHLICRAKMPDHRGRRKGPVEFYSTGRYFCFTGRPVNGFPTVCEERQPQIEALLDCMFPEQPNESVRSPTSSDATSTLSDTQLLDKARAVKNGDKFTRLWSGNIADYDNDQSRADAALLSLLRFWTGGDKYRSFYLFGQSALGHRDKWQRSDYRDATWAAIDSGEVYSSARSTTKPPNADEPLKVQPHLFAKICRNLETKFGPPYFLQINEKTGEKKYQGLNESFFAGLHAAQNIELFEPTERTFYKYEKRTGLYQDSTIDAIKQEISESILAMARTVNLIGLVKDRSDKRLAAIASQLKGVIEKRDAFKKRKTFIHLANGVLVFRNDDADLTEFSPDYFSRNKSPITYDPKARCDRFLNELILPAVHPEDVAIIQKYIGLCLLGRNIIQRFLILDGTPGGGKSQLAIAIQHLIGLLNCTQLRTEHLNERFEIYRFLKKTLLVGVDVPADFLSTKGATAIKGLVGGDILDAEQKNGTGCFPMEGTFCIVVTSNSRLRVRLEGDTGAWRRRLLIVRYEAPPPAKKIPDFGQTLVAIEGSGILNWALKGLAALLRDVNEIGDIQLTTRQSGMVDALLAESDSLRCFLRDCVIRSDTSDLTVLEIIQAYAEYCPTMGWNPMPITIIQRQVEALMLELFQTVKVHSIERDEKPHKGFNHVCFK